jgi:tRNA nucleotidyltransferase/poly(A) polymerase
MRVSSKVLRALRGRKPLWRFLESFCRAVDDAGGKSYLVGGFVRDLVEGKAGKDIDLMVAGMGFENLGGLLRSLPAKRLGLGRVLPVGKAFAVYKVRATWADEEIDIALARAERSTGPGHRDFTVRTKDVDARKDVARRDFTINSLLFAFRREGPLLAGSVVDFFGGIGDLKRNLIRGVGKPEERFREDPLRILRAIRQKNERRGGSIEKGTWKAILRAAPGLLRSISGERVAVELLRSLSANPVGTVEDLSRAGILQTLLPEPATRNVDFPDRMKRRYRVLEKSLGRPLPPALLFANLLVDASKAEFEGNMSDERKLFRLPLTESAARRLQFPQVRTVVRLLEDRNRLANARLLRNPHARLESLLGRWKTPEPLLALDEAVRKTEGGKEPDFRASLARAGRKLPLLTGQDLLDAGIPAGPRVKSILEEVREATLTGRIRRREEAKTLALSLYRARTGN